MQPAAKVASRPRLAVKPIEAKFTETTQSDGSDDSDLDQVDL